jgi:hypothetical protein
MGFHRDVTPCSLAKLAKGWAAAAIALLSAAGSASAQLAEVWDRTERYVADVVLGLDQAADVLAWSDETDPEDVQHYVYVTGYMTNDYGGKFLAVFRYNTANPGSGIEFDFFPSDFATTTLDHQGVALTIDTSTGDPVEPSIYAAGFTDNGEDGKDYVTIKYDKDLTRHASWGDVGPGVGIRIYDRGSTEDAPVDIIVADAHPEKVVVVLGTTLLGSGEDDITTVWYEAGDGDFVDSDHYTGPGDGVDTAAEMAFNPSRRRSLRTPDPSSSCAEPLGAVPAPMTTWSPSATRRPAVWTG